MSLRQLLDSVSSTSDDQTNLNQLGDRDWLILGAIAYAATFGAASSKIVLSPPKRISLVDELGRTLAEAELAKRTNDESSDCAILFSDVPWCVTAVASSGPTPAWHNPMQLIRAIAIARDHVDSALY